MEGRKAGRQEGREVERSLGVFIDLMMRRDSLLTLTFLEPSSLCDLQHRLVRGRGIILFLVFLTRRSVFTDC